MDQENIKAAMVMLKCLANERRLLIVCLLNEHGEQSVGALEKQVNLSQSALSQHLARLRKDGLVTTRRDAQTIYYSIPKDSPVLCALGCLHQLFG